MSVLDTSSAHLAGRSSRTKRNEGIALVVVLLAAMVLMVSMLAISATMALLSQRTTMDQGATLQAQYAAESGVAYAETRFTEAIALLPLLKFDQTIGRASIQAAINDYYGASSKPLSSVVGQKYCNGEATNSNRKFTLFANYITDVSGADGDDAPYLSSYPAATSDLAARQTYWRDMFAGPDLTRTVNTAAPTGTTATYTVKYGFTPSYVKLMTGGYRIFFKPVEIESIGTVSANGNVIASRKLKASPNAPLLSMDVSRNSFSNYNYFVNRRALPSFLGGSKLNFFDTDSFEGRVHVNGKDQYSGAAYFSASSSTKGARFYGGFTSVAKQLYWSSATKVSEKLLFPGGYKLGADSIDLPDNATSQRRAVIGGDSEDTSALGPSDIATHYGIKSTLDKNLSAGIYYGEGKQAGDTWGGNTDASGIKRDGGIYVKGDVDDLKLTTAGTAPNNFQVITIKQTTGTILAPIVTTTTFTQTSLDSNSDGSPKSSWTMKQDVIKSGKTTTTNQTINKGNFNGLVFVEGNIGDSGSQRDGNTEGLGGDGTTDQKEGNIDKEAPDIASRTETTVAASGDIFIKRNLTYTADPRTVVDDPATLDVDESAQNVLGIYSEGGDVKVDGVYDKNIKVQASLMATGTDINLLSDEHGFGTNQYSRSRSSTSKAPQIELLGGIIEDQSQDVVQSGSTENGYSRNFKWDKRFDSGFTPPFFPTQLRFTQKCQEGDPGVGNIVKPTCSRNTQMVWSTAAGN